jgi:hypothetical protein
MTLHNKVIFLYNGCATGTSAGAVLQKTISKSSIPLSYAINLLITHLHNKPKTATGNKKYKRLTHTYSFNDAVAFTLGKEIIYYRLKQIDNDGRFTYSKIIIISIDNKNACLLFPNPVAEKANLCITISKSQQVKASVIDNTGKKVKEFLWNLQAGSTSFSIDVSGLAKGIYFLDIKGATISEHKSFTRQ